MRFELGRSGRKSPSPGGQRRRALISLMLGLGAAVSNLGWGLVVKAGEFTEKAEGSAGQGAASGSTTTNLGAAPQAGQSGEAGILPPPRPRTGLTEEEYQARKAAASKGQEPGSGLPAAPTPPAQPSPQ
jgi:hypothetical protein